MQNFVHTENLTRFIDLLEREDDAVKRDTLQRLLFEEVDRARTNEERLDQTDLLIAAGRVRIERQIEAIAVLADGGRDTVRAQLVLDHMRGLHRMLVEFRHATAEVPDQAKETPVQ